MTESVLIAGMDAGTRQALLEKPELVALIAPNSERLDSSLGRLLMGEHYHPMVIWDFESINRTRDNPELKVQKKGLIFLVDADQPFKLGERMELEMACLLLTPDGPILVMIHRTSHGGRSVWEVENRLNLLALQNREWHSECFSEEHIQLFYRGISHFTTLLMYVVTPAVTRTSD